MGIRDIDRKVIEEFDRRFYPGVPDNWDNDIFRDMVLQRLQPSHSLLDIGAGRGALAQMNFKDQAARVVGIDPDPAVLDNPYLDQALVLSGDAMTELDDASFDIVVCNNVIEHLPDAPGFFSEVARVMKPGAALITKTPNKNHYMALIARVTPTSFHERVTAWRGRPVVDTFPTTYPANTATRQRDLAERVGLVVADMQIIESRPEYLRMTTPLYVAGVLYERAVNRLGLDAAKIVMFTVFVKPPTG